MEGRTQIQHTSSRVTNGTETPQKTRTDCILKITFSTCKNTDRSSYLENLLRRVKTSRTATNYRNTWYTELSTAITATQ